MPSRVRGCPCRLTNTHCPSAPRDMPRSRCNALAVSGHSGNTRSLRSCKYLHERNYDDLGNMLSSVPRMSV